MVPDTEPRRRSQSTRRPPVRQPARQNPIGQCGNQLTDGMRPRHLHSPQDQQGLEGFLDRLLGIEAHVFKQDIRRRLALSRPRQVAPSPAQPFAWILGALAVRRHTLRAPLVPPVR